MTASSVTALVLRQEGEKRRLDEERFVTLL
jgi:hypothetical protein